MSDRMIHSLQTLRRREDHIIKSYSVELKVLNDQIAQIDNQIAWIEKDIQQQNDFLKNSQTSDLPPLAYFNRMNEEIKNLEYQKGGLERQLETLFEQLFTHVTNEKAYSKIHEKLLKEKKSELEKKESDALEDLFSILTNSTKNN